MRKYDPTWPRMAFANPVFGPATMTTVRLGRKWLDSFENGQVDVVALDARGKPCGRLYIEKVAYVPFNEVGAFLASNHDPDCRDYHALRDEMRACYGSAFGVGSMVSVVYFQKEE